jgi:hypothetical protein
MSRSSRWPIYIFVLERSLGGFLRFKFNIEPDNKGVQTISVGTKDTSLGYSQQVVDQVEALATRIWSELSYYTLEAVANIRADKTGLRLTFKQGSTIKLVELDFENGEETLALYDP